MYKVSNDMSLSTILCVTWPDIRQDLRSSATPFRVKHAFKRTEMKTERHLCGIFSKCQICHNFFVKCHNTPVSVKGQLATENV